MESKVTIRNGLRTQCLSLLVVTHYAVDIVVVVVSVAKKATCYSDRVKIYNALQGY